MTQLRRLALAMIVVTIFGAVLMLPSFSNWLYDQFREAERNTVAQFDMLNQSVINALPPPPEVTRRFPK